jgi:hypothetical protein
MVEYNFLRLLKKYTLGIHTSFFHSSHVILKNSTLTEAMGSGRGAEGGLCENYCSMFPSILSIRHWLPIVL